MTDRPHILVTGSSRGIGAAIVARLLPHARVVGHASRDAIGTIGADLADPAAPRHLWDTALDRLDGRIDALIANAGIFEAAPIDLDDAAWTTAWERTLRVNLTATAELARLAVRHFQQAGREGRIVAIASRAAHRGDSPAHWHYAAAKAGLIGMTKTIARAYAREGIYAFAIAPGFTVTGDRDAYIASRGGERLLADIPLGRPAEADEVAEAAAFCALSAPPSMTGAVLDVNGASYVR